MSSHPATIVADVQVRFDHACSLELKAKTEFHDLEHYPSRRLGSAPGIGDHMRVSV